MSRDNKSSYNYFKTIRAMVLTLVLLGIYWLSQHIYKSVDHYNAAMTYSLINNQAVTIVPAVFKQFEAFEYSESTITNFTKLRKMVKNQQDHDSEAAIEAPKPERKSFNFKKSMDEVIANDDLWGGEERRFPFEYKAGFQGTDADGKLTVISDAMILNMDLKGQPINDLLCAEFRRERVKNPTRNLGCITENGINTVWYDLRSYYRI